MNTVAGILRHAHQLGAEINHVASNGHVHTRWMHIPHADGQLPYAAES